MRQKGRVIEINAKTKRRKISEKEFDFPDVQPIEPVGVNLNEVREMLEWYKKHVKPTLK